jgi:hypothetical protein
MYRLKCINLADNILKYCIMDNLERIANALKDKVGQFEPDTFARQMTAYINGITLPWNESLIRGLVSPFRQLFYLFNLNITSSPANTYQNSFDQYKDWSELKSMLAEMEAIHTYEYGEQKPFDETLFKELEREEVIRRRTIGSSTYNAFFHVGPLHFEEQAIEKISELYKNFDTEFTAAFGWSSRDALFLYDTLDNLFGQKKDQVFLNHPKEELSQDEFKGQVLSALKNGKSFEEAMSSTSASPIAKYNYIADPSIVNVFSLEDLKDCSPALVKEVLEHLTATRSTDDSFLFFNQPNQLYKKPIYRLADGNYLIIDHRVFLSAMSMFLREKCGALTTNKNRITQARDKFLERKLESIFADFYQTNKQVKIIPSYYLEKGGSERDLLILAGKVAIIIEAKAGKVREPMYDPDKAYTRIWQDFKETIDYGYVQAYSVKEKFMAKKPFEVYDKKQNVLLTIDPKAIKEVYSIIVTYNKFGHVQSDLQLMLELFDDDNQFPWALCIDDLEIFLLGLKKMKFTEKDFYRFLQQRAGLHGDLIVNDEGQITGQFLKHKRILLQKGTYRFSPADDFIYDDLYSTGLGFKNERGMERKKDPRYLKVV